MFESQQTEDLLCFVSVTSHITRYPNIYGLNRRYILMCQPTHMGYGIALVPGYFKIGECIVVWYPVLHFFMCRICVPVISMVCRCPILAIYVHHS